MSFIIYTDEDFEHKFGVEYDMVGREVTINSFYDMQTSQEIDEIPDNVYNFIEQNHNEDEHD